MIRLTTRAPEEVAELPLELLWELRTPPSTTAQGLFLEVFSLLGEEREKLFDIERVFVTGRPRGEEGERRFSSHVIWHSGHSNGRHHSSFPHEIIAERLEGKLDPLRLTLGSAALEGTFHELLETLLEEETRLGGPVDERLRELVRAESTTVVW